MTANPTRPAPLTPGVAIQVATPAPLTDREAELLLALVANTPVEGADVLLDQVRMLQLAPNSDPLCRIYVTHPEAPRSTFAADDRTQLPARARVCSPDGHEAGLIRVWVDHGHLRALQYIPTDGRTQLTLPPVEWLRFGDDEAAPAMSPVLTLAAMQSLSAVRLITARPEPQLATAHAVASTPTPRRRRSLLRAVGVVLVILVASAAFAQGRSSGVDIAAARADGTARGTELGTAQGAIEGELRGTTEGALAGHASTYQTAFDAAQAKARAAARRAAARERREAAAAAARAATAARAYHANNTSCSGYRDARGYWICS